MKNLCILLVLLFLPSLVIADSPAPPLAEGAPGQRTLWQAIILRHHTHTDIIRKRHGLPLLNIGVKVQPTQPPVTPMPQPKAQ
jgi:hypothetical protein